MTDVRAHMRQAPNFVEFEQRVQAAELEKDNPRRVERDKQNSAVNVVEASKQDIVWNSYFDLEGHYNEHLRLGSLPSLPETRRNENKSSARVGGKEVKRQPVIDDFVDRIREDDGDNHLRLEGYPNPLSPVGVLHWFQATMLATMIENGRLGVKKTLNGTNAVYMHRSRTGNPFFRIFGGRTTLALAVLQWFLFLGVGLGIADSGEFALAGEVILAVALLPFFIYNLVHWRFYKRYEYVLGGTVVDGFKARLAPSGIDALWAKGRLAVVAINLSFFTSLFIYFTARSFKVLGVL